MAGGAVAGGAGGAVLDAWSASAEQQCWWTSSSSSSEQQCWWTAEVKKGSDCQQLK